MTTPAKRNRKKTDEGAFRFHPAKLDALFTALDAVAWLDAPDVGQVAQFAGIDPRTAGKLLRNGVALGLLDAINNRQYTLALPYPYKGSLDQKKGVVREALVRLPLLAAVRQFMKLGDSIDVSTRKAATVSGMRGFDPKHFATLLEWAKSLDVLRSDVIVEDLLDKASEIKELRHQQGSHKIVAFLSHSSKDKPFIRQLAGDLSAEDIGVWLDEQRIRVGDSIPDRIAQGLAESDFFLIAVSQHSAGSAWVQKELSNALVSEIERRRVTILPLKLDDTPMPAALKDKKYADFSRSYKTGLEEVITALKEHSNAGHPEA